MPAIARYDLVRRIGMGGMAEVWKAVAFGPAGFQKTVAIKKVHPNLAASKELVTMFVAEAKLVADLVHPNIVQVYDFGEAGPREYYIAMEYVAGQNLSALIKRCAERDVAIAYEIAVHVGIECCKALAYAHAKSDARGKPLGIVHRDVSPQNVMITWDGDVKITDFGIARVASTIPSTEAGVVRGNAAYLSPEQAALEPLDKRTDLFSLGLVLYELLVGKRLFTGNNPILLVQQAVDFRFPLDAVAFLPREMQTVLANALRRDLHRRFQDAGEMMESLAQTLAAGGLLDARRRLAELMQSVFEKERREETSAEPGPGKSVSISISHPSDESATPAGETASSDLQARTEPPQATVIVPRPGPPPKSAPSPRRLLPLAGLGVAALALFAIGLGLPILPHAKTTPAPTPTRIAVATQTPVTPLPTETPAAAVTAATLAPTPKLPLPKPARLTVDARPWCEVWVDGKRVVEETPLSGHKLSPGHHVLLFVNAALGLRLEKPVDLKPGESLELFVDAEAKTVR